MRRLLWVFLSVVGALLVVACGGRGSPPGEFVAVQVEAPAGAVAVDAVVEFDTSALQFVGSTSTGLVADSVDEGRVRLAAVDLEHRDGTLAVASFRVLRSGAEPRLVKANAVDRSGAELAGANARMVRGTRNEAAGYERPDELEAQAVAADVTLQASFADYVLGDVDQGGSVTISDALAVLTIAAGSPSSDAPTDFELYVSDVNGNAAVTVSDAVLVLQRVVDADLEADLVVRPGVLQLDAGASGLILVGNAGNAPLSVSVSAPTGVSVTPMGGLAGQTMAYEVTGGAGAESGPIELDADTAGKGHVSLFLDGSSGPGPFDPVRINAGGGDYVDAMGDAWAADVHFDDGTAYPGDGPKNVPIANTVDDLLYQTERYGEFSYVIPVPVGEYDVVLHFAEIYHSSSVEPNTTLGVGARVFSVAAEGSTFLSDYDLFADAGADAAVQKELAGVVVTDGQLDLDFTYTEDNAKISAIEVLEADGGATGGEPSALFAITPGADLAASTYDADAFQLTNTGDEPITSLAIDFGTTVLPDMVFDPVGEAGDALGKCLEIASGAAATGFVTPADACTDPFSSPHGGDPANGYEVLSLTFTDFGPGESITFAVDVDPTSIKNASGTGGSGAVSGVELSGATVTVGFAAGSYVGQPFRDASDGGAEAVLAPTRPSAPGIDVAGVTTGPTTLSADHLAATVSDASQTIELSGPAGSAVKLLQIEAALQADPGNDVEAFEANEALATTVHEATLSAGGTATIPVSLADGLNYFMAVTQDGPVTGATSEVVILDLQAAVGTSPSALLEVNPGGGLTASTFGGGSFQIANTGDVAIVSVGLDLAGALLPDVVFDPVGTAGDATAKCLTVDAGGAATGYIAPGNACVDPFGAPHNGVDGDDGYQTVALAFGDFEPSESFTFSVDLDPTSIKNASTTGDAGSVSGFELVGSTVTVAFADGSELEADLFDEGSLGGSAAWVAAPTPAAPSIAMDGVTLPATVADPSQTILVTGEPGADVTLLLADARLYVGAGSGYDVGPFEANEVVAKVLDIATLDGSGEAAIPVTLLRTTPGSGPEAGLNHLIAAVDGPGGQYGRTSQRLVVEFDPAASSDAEIVYRVNAGGPELAAADGPAWSADTDAAPSPYVNLPDGGTELYETGDAIGLHASVPTGTPMALFQTERYDVDEPETSADDTEMAWSFPLASGVQYEVRVYVAEIYLTEETNDTAGPRQFDVAVEGVVPDTMAGIDQFASYGEDGAMLTTTVALADDVLDIEFLRISENPAVKGIEIVKLD